MELSLDAVDAVVVGLPRKHTVSGAFIWTDEVEVLKWAEPGSKAGEIIGKQGRWIKEHPQPFLPKVDAIWDNAYTMDRLVPLPEFCDGWFMTKNIVGNLRTLWDEPQRYRCDMEQHHDYLDDRKVPGEILDWLDALLPTFYRLPEVVTHGDPTWDNCMLDMDGRLVLTDPIQNAGLPSVRAMDIGKLIQSAFGYEAVTHDFGADLGVDELRSMLHIYEEEWQVCLYFAAVHFSLLSRYTPQFGLFWDMRIRRLLDMRNDCTL